MFLDDVFDLAKSQLLVAVCVLLPLTVSVATQKLEARVMEFRAYRIQQFDYHGNFYGSRAWRVSYEASTLGSKNLLRRCLVVWWRDLIKLDLRDVLQQTLGSVVIMIPQDLNQFNEEEQEEFMELEHKLTADSFTMPIYLAFSTPDLKSMLQSLRVGSKSQAGSALSAIVDGVTANAFQLVNSNHASTAKIDKPIYNIVGRLSAYERGLDVPTIAIVAYYDSFGVAPALSFGADSNGSGVAALLELARIFHKLYQNAKTRAKYNLVFLLTGGGKLNFQGSRQWIEEQLDQGDGSLRLEFAMCLDGLGQGQELKVHVSKLPKEGTSVDRFVGSMEEAAETRFRQDRNVTYVQKKINLADEFLSWEHERYNIRKLRGFTLSHFPSPKLHTRRSIMDRRKSVDTKVLSENVEIIAEALLRQLYDIPPGKEARDAILGKNFVQERLLKAWMDMLTEGGRSSQGMVDGGKAPIVADLLNTLDHHTHEANLIPIVPDKKDPEFVLYGAVSDTIVVHKVKPAVFDLLLAGFIAAYLGLMYEAVLNFHGIFGYVKLLCTKVVKLKGM